VDGFLEPPLLKAWVDKHILAYGAFLDGPGWAALRNAMRKKGNNETYIFVKVLPGDKRLRRVNFGGAGWDDVPLSELPEFPMPEDIARLKDKGGAHFIIYDERGLGHFMYGEYIKAVPLPALAPAHDAGAGGGGGAASEDEEGDEEDEDDDEDGSDDESDDGGETKVPVVETEKDISKKSVDEAVLAGKSESEAEGSVASSVFEGYKKDEGEEDGEYAESAQSMSEGAPASKGTADEGGAQAPTPKASGGSKKPPPLTKGKRWRGAEKAGGGAAAKTGAAPGDLYAKLRAGMAAAPTSKSKFQKPPPKRKRRDTTLNDAQQAAFDALPDIPKTRKNYTTDQRRAIWNLYAAMGKNKSSTSDLVRSKEGYKAFSRQMLGKWEAKFQKRGTIFPQRRGKKVGARFDAAVYNRLVFNVAAKGLDQAYGSGKKGAARARQHASTVISCIYNYETVKVAGMAEKIAGPWAVNKVVQKLKFSDCWVTGFLKRHGLTRQRVTRRRKCNRPDVPAVNKWLKDLTAALTQMGFTRNLVFSVDETPGYRATNPHYEFAKKNSGGGIVPDSPDKERFTVMLGVNADGDFVPLAYIIKCAFLRPPARRP